MYQEISPSQCVSSMIDSFWIFKNDQQREVFNVLPDTCIDIICNLKQNHLQISGVMSKSGYTTLEKGTHLLGIRFKAERLARLTKIPIHKIRNLTLELRDVMPESSLLDINFSRGLVDLRKLLLKLERNIVKDLHTSKREADDLVIGIVDQIRHLHGKVNVGRLARANYISLRQLERRFRSYVGLSIKEFAIVVRFQNVQKLIKERSDLSLSMIAYEAGYSDYSHMNLECKRLAGLNPSAFR